MLILTWAQGMQHALPQGASASSLAESEMSADGLDSNDDDSEASDGDVAEWDPQPGDAPPLAPGVIKLAEGVLDADVKEVYSRLLADQVTVPKWPCAHSLAGMVRIQERNAGLGLSSGAYHTDLVLQSVCGLPLLAQPERWRRPTSLCRWSLHLPPEPVLTCGWV